MLLFRPPQPNQPCAPESIRSMISQRFSLWWCDSNWNQIKKFCRFEFIQISFPNFHCVISSMWHFYSSHYETVLPHQTVQILECQNITLPRFVDQVAVGNFLNFVQTCHSEIVIIGTFKPSLRFKKYLKRSNMPRINVWIQLKMCSMTNFSEKYQA